MSDPRDLPGLAHFCEHMLFLGTEKVRTVLPFFALKYYKRIKIENSYSLIFSTPQKTNTAR